MEISQLIICFGEVKKGAIFFNIKKVIVKMTNLRNIVVMNQNPAAICISMVRELVNSGSIKIIVGQSISLTITIAKIQRINIKRIHSFKLMLIKLSNILDWIVHVLKVTFIKSMILFLISFKVKYKIFFQVPAINSFVMIKIKW